MEAFGQSWPFSTGVPFPFNHQRLAERNRSSVLGLIWRKRCLSQKALTARTGLQASTVSNIIRELKTAGMVEDGLALEAERVGPKETELEIVPGYGWTVGLAFDKEFRMVVINSAGQVLAERDFPPDYTESRLVQELPEVLAKIQKRHRLSSKRFAGVGVSVAGVVDPDLGMVLLSRNLGERSEPLQARLQEALKVPVMIERNVVCGAYAEHFSGAVRDVDSFLYFAITRHGEEPPGFGLAIVIDERIFRGNHSAAGEIDFLIGSLLPANVTPATSGTVFYAKCGEALAAIVNLLDIGCLVLADDELSDERLKTLEERMLSQLVSVPGRSVSVRRSTLQYHGRAFGAALMMLHRKMARDLAAFKHDPLSPNGRRRTNEPESTQAPLVRTKAGA